MGGNERGNWLKGGNGVRFNERNYAFAGTANKTLEQPKIIDITPEKAHAEARRMF